MLSVLLTLLHIQYHRYLRLKQHKPVRSLLSIIVFKIIYFFHSAIVYSSSNNGMFYLWLACYKVGLMCSILLNLANITSFNGRTDSSTLTESTSGIWK